MDNSHCSKAWNPLPGLSESLHISFAVFIGFIQKKKCIEHPLYCMCCRNYWEIRNKKGTISVFKEHALSRSPVAESLLT